MPHLTVEYSANLDGRVDMHTLCEALRAAAVATSIFETGAIRVRALACDAYALADGDERNSFVDVSVRIAQGRDGDTKKKLGDALFAALSAVLAPLLATHYLAVSLEVREIDATLSWTINPILERLRGG